MPFCPQSSIEDKVYVNALSFVLRYPLSDKGKSEIITNPYNVYTLFLFYCYIFDMTLQFGEMKVSVEQDAVIDKKQWGVFCFLVPLSSCLCKNNLWHYCWACDTSNSWPTLIAMQSNKFGSNSEHQRGLEIAVSIFLWVLNVCWSLVGNSSYSANNKSLHLFAANIGHCYSCKKESLFMGNGLYLDVSEDRMQAFNLTKSIDFGTRECLHLEIK